jgi:dihydroorotate dehydrogenase (NAD+) catalytic subunit
MGLIPDVPIITEMNRLNPDKPKMAVDIGGLVIKNPVMTASGTFGYGEEYAPYLDLNRLGAIIVKGISMEPRAGNPPPRIMETPCGMLNAIGLENPGVNAFVNDKLPFLRQFDVAVVVNVFGETIDEFKKVAEILSAAKGIHGLEINISCPNVRKGGMVFGSDPDMAYEVTKEVKHLTDLPVIVKLTPNVTDICLIAESVQDAGADAVSLINTLTGMSVDIEKRSPHLKNITGGLSGPAIKPVALRMVWQVAKKVKIPVIGIGGIMSARDALEFLIVGAKAIQIGTANFINPHATIDIIDGIEAYLTGNNCPDVNELIGTLNTGRGSELNKCD